MEERDRRKAEKREKKRRKLEAQTIFNEGMWTITHILRAQK